MTGRELKNGIKGKGLTLEEAAAKLRMDRSTLWRKLKENPLDPDFLKDATVALGIGSSNGSQQSDATLLQNVGSVQMRMDLVKLKNDRYMQISYPKDFNRDDIKALNKWIELQELSL